MTTNDSPNIVVNRAEWERLLALGVSLNDDGDYVPNTLDLIEAWARARNLIDGATSKDQVCKLIQEVGELSDAVCKGDKANLEDEIGDCIVVLKILATQNKLSLGGCATVAYNKIKDRRGIMKDGIFIKEEDLKDE